VKPAIIVALALALALPACGGSPAAPAEASVVAKPSAAGADKSATPSAAKAAPEPAKPAAGPHEGLLDPSKAKLTAPATFKAKFETTKGDFVIEIQRDWAPNGVDRFYSLVTVGYYEDIALYRVIDGFMVQFGIHGDPKMNKIWKDATILDDKVTQSNTPGMLTFATRGANTRTTQLFINYGQNVRLDGMGFAPFGKVIEGMDVVNNIHSGYGEGAPRGRGPSQPKMQGEGNTYLRADFPDLDYIESISIAK
jgi:peptidyl-prolyl cis-trans isomerase A (cyclophilin A)